MESFAHSHATVLLGLNEAHVVPWMDGHAVHRDAYESLKALERGAKENGFELRVCSAFRGFEKQVSIWNAKADGSRPIFGDDGRILELASLTEVEIVRAILRWSALPGLSRHHWGSDIDVYDAAAVPAGYRVRLSAEECAGTFREFHAWLDREARSYGFFRPFDRDRGGVAPEPWHLSYAPVSEELRKSHSLAILESVLSQADLRLKKVVLTMLPEIFERYFVGVAVFS